MYNFFPKTLDVKKNKMHTDLLFLMYNVYIRWQTHFAKIKEKLLKNFYFFVENLYQKKTTLLRYNNPAVNNMAWQKIEYLETKNTCG